MGDDDAVAEHVDAWEGVLNGGDELARCGSDALLLFLLSSIEIDLYRNNAVRIVQKHGRIGSHMPSTVAAVNRQGDACTEGIQKRMYVP